MRNRMTLLLMEQLVMVLVFGLAAALCLRGFAEASDIAEQTRRRDLAVAMACSGAETIKASRGNLEEAARILGGRAGENSLTLEREDCRLEAVLQDSDIPGLGQAQVQVTDGEETLFSLTVAWQEVGE